MKCKLSQKGGDNSNNLQIVNVGLQYTEARQIAIDVFDNNFYKLSQQAASIAIQRNEELINEFLHKISTVEQNIINKLQEPSVQYSLYNVQREYAKTGDIELKEQLLGLLTDRICSNERSLKQIVLDEAIETLPKLAKEQLNFITFIYIIQNLAVKLLQKEFSSDITFDASLLINNLKLFCEFSSKDLRQHVVGHLQYLGCIREIIDNGDMFDSPILTINELAKRYSGVELEEKDIVPVLKSIHANFAKYYRLWRMRKNSTIKLTTVGLVIAIAHYNRQTNSNIDIDDFI